MSDIKRCFQFRLSEELVKEYPSADFIYNAKHIGGGTIEVTWEENGEPMGPVFYDASTLGIALVDQNWKVVQ